MPFMLDDFDKRYGHLLQLGVRSSYEIENDRSPLKQAFRHWLYQSGFLCDSTSIGPLFDAFKIGWMMEAGMLRLVI